MKQSFFICEHCGNVVAMIKDSGVPVMCCGQKMTELIPGTGDGAEEKHVPVFTVDGDKVYVVVGDVEHPMTEAHHIAWISLQTKAGNQIKYLAPTDKPAVCFAMSPRDEIEAVYAYCNLHGLWVAENVTPLVCNLKPLDTETSENYTVCACNNVSYFDVLNAVHDNKSLDNLLAIFDNVKNTTRCSTGCGGCYEKVIAIISEMMSGKLQ